MICIAPERFVEILEQGGLDAAGPEDRVHLEGCSDCREAWSQVASADAFLAAVPAPRRREASRFPALFAAAVVLVAAGAALFWKPAEPEPVPIPVTGQEAKQDPPIDTERVAELYERLKKGTSEEQALAEESLVKMGPGIRGTLGELTQKDVGEMEHGGPLWERIERVLQRLERPLEPAQLDAVGKIAFTWSDTFAFDLRSIPELRKHLHIAIFDEGKSRMLTEGFSPAWSPDGKRIAFVSVRDGNHEIYVIDADGKNLKRLTNNGMNDLTPRWSPDGKFIVFATDRDGNYEIYSMNAEGGDLVRLTEDVASDFSPDWSPRENEIVFVSARDGNDEIYEQTIDRNVSDRWIKLRMPRRLTHCPVFDEAPRYSPDGDRIVFMSSRARPEEEGAQLGFDVYVMDATGENPDRLTLGDTGTWPTWAPDGSRVVYLREGGIVNVPADLAVIDLSRRETRVLIPHEGEAGVHCGGANSNGTFRLFRQSVHGAPSIVAVQQEK